MNPYHLTPASLAIIRAEAARIRRRLIALRAFRDAVMYARIAR